MTIHQFSIREDTLDGGRCDKYGTGNNPVLCIQNKGASAQIRALEGGLGCCCQLSVNANVERKQFVID